MIIGQEVYNFPALTYLLETKIFSIVEYQLKCCSVADDTAIDVYIKFVNAMQRLVTAWSGLEQRVVDKAINEWHGRLRACVRADGQHFEHLL